MLNISSGRIIIFIVFVKTKALDIDPDRYIPFLFDIKQYYKSSGIILLYDEQSDRLSMENNVAEMVKKLSVRGLQSQGIPYSKTKTKLESVFSVCQQSLFVVFLTSQENLSNFLVVTERYDMSFHRWVVVFAKFISAETDAFCRKPLGNPFHLEFNSRLVVQCYATEVITKWYSLHDNRTEVLELAKWNPQLGLTYNNNNYYQMRYDLSGKTIRLATHTNSTAEMNGKMTGFLEDIVEELRNFMNFSVARVREEDAYGKWNPETRRWSGLIGLLTNGEADLVVSPITVSKFRLDFVDFTRPLMLSGNRIYVKQPDGTSIQWSAYFRAFTLASWLSIAVMLIVVSLTIAFIKLTINQPKFSRASINYLLEHFIGIWGVYCQQGISEFPTLTPLRLTYFTIISVTFVIWAIYSASITSYITVLTPSLPFSDTEGFVNDGTYKVIVLQNSSDQDIILSGSDPVLSLLRPLLKNPDELPMNPYSGFKQVCEEKVGFYTNEAILRGVSAYIPCTLTYIETGQFECLAMVLTKKSPYIDPFNYNLRKLEDNGVMKKLHNWYFRKLDNVVEASHSPIGFWGVAPLLAIFTLGFSLSILFLVLENIYYSRIAFHKKPVDPGKILIRLY